MIKFHLYHHYYRIKLRTLILVFVSLLAVGTLFITLSSGNKEDNNSVHVSEDITKTGQEEEDTYTKKEDLIPKKEEKTQIYKEEITLTFCILPYPLSKKNSELLRDKYFFTFSSWLLTAPTTKLYIMMPREEFDPDLILLPTIEKLLGPNRILFGPDVETDEDGVPYIDDWFINGLDNTNSSVLCWINADIIIPNGWYQRIQFLYDHFHNIDQQISVISRRCDFDFESNTASELYRRIKSYADFRNVSDVWPPDYDEISKERKLHTSWGIDFFLVSREPMQINFDDIPHFHMGKYRWDPWITGWLREHMPLITLGDEFCTYHMNHVPKDRQTTDVKVKENLEMAARHKKYNVPNGLASYMLRGRGLFKKNENTSIAKLPDFVPPCNAPSTGTH